MQSSTGLSLGGGRGGPAGAFRLLNSTSVVFRHLLILTSLLNEILSGHPTCRLTAEFLGREGLMSPLLRVVVPRDYSGLEHILSVRGSRKIFKEESQQFPNQSGYFPADSNKEDVLEEEDEEEEDEEDDLEVKEENGVLVLSDANFDNFVADKDTVLLEFYAPW